jgi:hypothetical protein
MPNIEATTMGQPRRNSLASVATLVVAEVFKPDAVFKTA